MAQQLTEAPKRTPRTAEIENRLKLSPEQLRAIAIYQDYSEGTTNGLAKFAAAIGFSRQGTYNVINGDAPITKRFINACVKLGYSAEWVMYGTGNMMLNKKDKLSLTDIAEVKAHVSTLVSQLHAKDVRIEGLQKQIDSFKNDLKDIKKMLAENGIHYRSH